MLPVTYFMSMLNCHKGIQSFSFLSLQPIPENVFIVAACNPQRGNSLVSHRQKETWIRGTYYVRQLHPTLHLLMWDYGSLDKDQEREYIKAKMKMLYRQNDSNTFEDVCVQVV